MHYTNLTPMSRALLLAFYMFIRFWSLPIEYHIPKALIKIGNLVGKTVALDARNSTQVFQVGICVVEIDLNLSLPNRIMVRQRYFNMCFENLHVFCSTNMVLSLVNRNSHRTFDRPVESNFQIFSKTSTCQVISIL